LKWREFCTRLESWRRRWRNHGYGRKTRETLICKLSGNLKRNLEFQRISLLLPLLLMSQRLLMMLHFPMLPNQEALDLLRLMVLIQRSGPDYLISSLFI
jgi:hypothetical protein